MSKIRITISGVYEFDPETLPETAYAPGATLEEKLKAEVESAQRDPLLYLALDGARITATGEIVQ